jgi:hypothetical protein
MKDVNSIRKRNMELPTWREYMEDWNRLKIYLHKRNQSE